ncbi:DUF1178 family protein [Paraurantiacibacter namhicola]|uniref:Uncharacterized protein n=1 Tax=Paraurantiacibacter namhicola TaxID=645517 RepID=A0A1C7D992_9SPHN|nr:DUF1178 family protein [Paraurantiacibacter namhicola]ANU08056.1 hypothetical protein A6F65_01761 [Paraurantiacibacter namhicola]
MIVFDLSCDSGHAFEAWFRSSSAFADQQARGLVECPHCGSAQVAKAPMAPSVGRKGNQQVAPAKPSAPEKTDKVAGGDLPAEVKDALGKLAEAQAKALKSSTYVGKKFADESRAMHYGEKDAAPIHGEASLADAKELLEEGVTVAPLLVPVAKPDEVN